MANGKIQVEIVDTQKCLSAIDEVKKQISGMVGANKVRAIWEYANELKDNMCEPAGSEIQADILPAHLQQIIGDDIIAEYLCWIVQDWAKLKGYGHSEPKGCPTKG